MILSDVCLLHASGLTREQRPRKTKIGTEVAHVTRDSDTTFRVKKSKVNLLMSETANMPGQRHILSPCAQLA